MFLWTWAFPWASAFAQASTDPKNEIQADLGMTVIGLGYERVLSESFALGVEAEALSTWFGPWFDRPRLDGWGGGLRATWFPAGHAPSGLYVTPYLRLARCTGTLGNDMRPVPNRTSATVAAGLGGSGGVFVGHAWALGHSLDLRLGAGVQYIDMAVSVAGQHVGFEGPWPALDAVVSWRL